MYGHKGKNIDVPVKETTCESGLSDSDVQERIDAKLTNKTKRVVGKSIPEILITNLLTFFNLLLFAIAVLLIIGEMYSSLFFIIIYLANIGIGLFQDFRAHHLLGKLRLLTDPVAHVVRNGKTVDISIDDIVRDDIVILKTSNQVCADGIVVEGEVGVDESLLTGESLVVYKKPGSLIYSGTYIVSGKAYVRTTNVGTDNYANKLQNSAKKQQTKKSELKKSLDYLFRFIGAAVIIVGIATVVTQWDALTTSFQNAIGPLAGSLIAMIPAGLYLLSSVTLTVGVINLAKKRTLVQDFYSIEMLARSSVLCLDKTGTITDGTMEVVKLDNFSKLQDHEIGLLLANIVKATGDENATAKAIAGAYPYDLTDIVKEKLPFDSRNKYSAVTMSKGTYVLGALECMNVTSKQFYVEKCDPYLKKGLRVLTLAKSSGKIEGGKVVGSMDIMAFIVLKDHIRSDAKETFRWFSNNGVKIRVISGDNPVSVSEIASEVGIPGSEKFVSLDGMSEDQVREAATQYTVFGRVTPEQKSILVEALKANGEVVAMTGDGVNDILALRKADCSIAIASGAEAARNVSQLVLLDSDFSSLPSVVAEGRRVVNNLQRTCSLFLCKTFFAIFASVVFLILQWCGLPGYPFFPNHLYLWEITAIGLGAFFIAIEPNKEVLKGKFMSNILYNAIPGAALIIVAIALVFVLYASKLGIESMDAAISMCAIIFGVLPLVIFYRVCAPFSKYRLLVFLSILVFNIGALAVAGVLSVNGVTNEPLKIDFTLLTVINYVEIGLICIILSVLYVGISGIVKACLDSKEEVEANVQG